MSPDPSSIEVIRAERAWLGTVLEDPVPRIAGHEPGRWTLWTDMGVNAPIVLSDVDLGEASRTWGRGRWRPVRGSA
jgi:hypothetical protein